ncbi:FemAB-related protein, PEP-CTERM system-associated [Legionella massiliensis]|uniref:FemAB-related protein, PEP-CTERM system-associated n=1 Tax=Legionella massiliensis TaxID=1034943 RepID=A0A078L3U8_9GAMM|nr:GNAT family N-acetyltransferase [Legionella massiliensis]CDZ78809.1 FemAB-related protein, PEP-CTERM system-associated [Legionella massiliensis]CEE14547.1 hypothetical protein BN1094_03123 [Legionella massiliensis]
MVVARVYKAEDKSSWDRFVAQCKAPLFFFQRDYLEYHAHRFSDASLLFYQDEVLLAVFPASREGEVLSSHGGLTYGGLLLSERVRSETVITIIKVLAEKVYELGCKKIIYKAIPYLFYTQGSQEDLYALVNHLDAKIFRRDLSSVIYLNNRLKLSKGRKWLISRAQKLGLKVSRSSDWSAFHRLLASVLLRHGAQPVHSVSELETLAALFPDNIRLMVVEQEGVIEAAALLFHFHATVHTQYLATSETGKDLGALDFLIESCIAEAKSQGYSYFSFGISTEQQGRVLNTGLVAQKENFGARGVVLDFYEIELDGQLS